MIDAMKMSLEIASLNYQFDLRPNTAVLLHYGHLLETSIIKMIAKNSFHN